MVGLWLRTVGLVVVCTLALALPSAAGASSPALLGPSAADCAAGWNAAGASAKRSVVAAHRPSRAWVITTGTPSCVIHFLLKGKRVLTATSPWTKHGAMHWRLALREHSTFTTLNAQLFPDAKLRPNTPDAQRHYPVRGSPTIARCVAAWNSRSPSALQSWRGTAPRAVALTAQTAPAEIAGTVSSSGGGSVSRVVFGPQACVLTVAAAAHRVTRIAGAWVAGAVSGWHARTVTGSAPAPNAQLMPDGTLRRQ